jgi:3',5'-cyclic AMP phosphodiesterase CpdA
MATKTLKPINLAVLSDLHVGLGARSTDLSPYPFPDTRDTDFRKRFIEFIAKNKDIRPDYLIVPGDASHRGQPDELKLASQVICECADVLKVKYDKIIFVPGNHDADWSVFEHPDETGFRRMQKYAPLRNDEWIFAKSISRAKETILDPSYFCIWDDPRLLVIGYNSAWHDDSVTPVHHGLVSNDHLGNNIVDIPR